MFINYGDVNFFEYGCLIDLEHSDTVFDMLLCRSCDDDPGYYQFAHVQVDIEDSWIEKSAVLQNIGMDENDCDSVMFAIGCTEYYSWDNFGADDYGTNYNWQRMVKYDIYKELNQYMIASDGLDMPWKDPTEWEPIDGQTLYRMQHCKKTRDGYNFMQYAEIGNDKYALVQKEVDLDDFSESELKSIAKCQGYDFRDGYIVDRHGAIMPAKDVCYMVFKGTELDGDINSEYVGTKEEVSEMIKIIIGENYNSVDENY